MALPADNPQQRRADLSALADRTLEPSRRTEVEARIAASPELTALYERERRVVRALHQARETDRAPARLRARIEAQRPRARSRARRRFSYAGGLAGALAAILLAFVLILPSGTPGAPSLGQAAALAGRGVAAPAPDSRAPSVKLEQQVGNVYFPNWGAKFGWHAVGQRVDHINGRLAVTVYYKRRQATLAYTIVAAPALQQPAVKVTRVHATDLQTLRLGGRLVVTWRRAGHTCVLSAVSVPASALQHLAAWKAPGLVGST